MTYQETLAYLYNSAPLFQHVGKAAYKEGLENTLALDEYFGHPHKKFRSIHVAGTNGKGSCSHTLAAILQSAGYRVGLYTSPHLVDFRERIRINGIPVSQDFVIDFVENIVLSSNRFTLLFRTDYRNGISLFCMPASRCSCYRSRIGRTTGLH